MNEGDTQLNVVDSYICSARCHREIGNRYFLFYVTHEYLHISIRVVLSDFIFESRCAGGSLTLPIMSYRRSFTRFLRILIKVSVYAHINMAGPFCVKLKNSIRALDLISGSVYDSSSINSCSHQLMILANHKEVMCL